MKKSRIPVYLAIGGKPKVLYMCVVGATRLPVSLVFMGEVDRKHPIEFQVYVHVAL